MQSRGTPWSFLTSEKQELNRASTTMQDLEKIKKKEKGLNGKKRLMTPNSQLIISYTNLCPNSPTLKPYILPPSAYPNSNLCLRI